MPQKPIVGSSGMPSTLTIGGRVVSVLYPNNFNARIKSNGQPVNRYRLAVFLHGYGGDPTSTVNKWFGSADVARNSMGGTICLLPTGLTDQLGNPCWNSNGTCCALDMAGGLPGAADDVGFISALIELALTTFSILPGAVELFGYSNGGMMAHTMALCYSQRITAIYTFASYSPLANDARYCTPGNKVHVTAVGVEADAVVIYLGDPVGTVPTDKPTGIYQGVPATCDQWKTLNGCTGTLTQYDSINATDVVAGTETERYAYPGQAANGSVELWKVTGVAASHSVGMNTGFLRAVELRRYNCLRV